MKTFNFSKSKNAFLSGARIVMTALAIGLAVVSCDKKDGEGDDGTLPGNLANFTQGAKSKMSALGKCVEGSKIVCYTDPGHR